MKITNDFEKINLILLKIDKFFFFNYAIIYNKNKCFLILYPITLIAFNRPYHTFKTLNYLSINPEAKSSELYVFIDGPRNELDYLKIDQTEEVIKSFNNKFKKISIKRSTLNKGLALNVIDGVSEVLKEFEATIVLEDDIATSESFLNYMNYSLNELKDEIYKRPLQRLDAAEEQLSKWLERVKEEKNRLHQSDDDNFDVKTMGLSIADIIEETEMESIK